MAGDRIYTAGIDNVTIGTAVQDIFYIKAGAANGVELHYIELNAGGVTSPTEIRLRLKRLPVTVTAGSVGTAPTMSALDSGDTKTATAVVRANDTTQSSTSGTAANLAFFQWNLLLPFQFLPAPEDRPAIAAAEALVLDLPAALAATVAISGFIHWREEP